MSGPNYTGQRDGMHWWDTPNGPLGLAPEHAAPFLPQQSELPGAGSPDMAPGLGSQPAMIGAVDGFAPGVPDFQQTAAPVQGITDGLSGGPSVTISNDYRGKGGAKRWDADQARIQQLYPSAPPPQAPQPEAQPRGPVQFDGSMESALGMGMEAMDTQGAAQQQLTDLEAKDADAQAGLMAEAEAKRLKVQTTQEAQRAKEAQQLATYQGEVGRMVDEHTKMEVDRGRLWKNKSTANKVGLAISVALAGLGSAMKGQGDKNPALDIMMGAINDDVNDQMNAIQKHGADIQMRQGVVQGFMQTMGNAEAARAAAMARGITDMEQQAKMAMANTSSARVQANGELLLGVLGEKKAQYVGQGAQALFGRDMQLEQLNMQKAQLEEQRKARAAAAANQRRQLEWDREKFMMGREADIAAARAADDGKRAEALAIDTKDLQARGVFDPRNGKPMLQPEGEKLWQEAEALRAKGDVAGAASLESSAIAQHSLRTGDGSSVRKVMGSVQNAVTLADDVNRMRAKHGANWTKSSEGEQWMTSKAAILAMTLKDAYQLGALDKGSQDVINHMTGGDPSKLSASDIPLLGGLLGGAAGSKGKLDALVDALGTKAQTELRAVGYRGEWKPRREPATAPVTTETEKAVGDIQRGMGEVGRAPAVRIMKAASERAATGDAAALSILQQTRAKGGEEGQFAGEFLSELDAWNLPDGTPAPKISSVGEQGRDAWKLSRGWVRRYPKAAR